MSARYARLGGVLAVVLAVVVPVNAGAADKVTVALDFTLSGYHAPWFVAQDRGYFTEQGLEVQMGRGYGSGDTVKKLATGAADIGLNHPAPLIIANSEGGSLRVIMGYFNQEMCAMYSAAEGGNVRAPKDLEGQTFGGPPGDICTMMLPALAEKTGVDIAKVKVQQMDGPQRLAMLTAGKISVVGTFFDKDILIKRGLDQAGKTMVSFHYARYLSMYSLGVTASQATIDKRPEMVQKMVTALLRGFKFTVANPAEAAKITSKLYPELDADYVRASVDTLLEGMWDETSKAKGIGVLDVKKMQDTRDTVVKYWRLKAEPPLDQIYTNRFIEAAHRAVK
jgi:NitT/TauT family transport system substrate-binding protein